jgi:nucleoside-diphosphate-sugar epimerase
MRRSLFITGGTGFVGSRFLRSLDSASCSRIVCLSRTRPAAAANNIEYVQGDLLDRAVYAAALSECDTVVHLAAATGKCRPETYFRVNLEGTSALVDECRRAGTKHFLYVSTIAAKFSDTSHYYYAQSKRHAEEVVMASGLPYTIVRPTMVMGTGSPVLNGLSKLARLPVLPVFGNGRALVQPVAVDDLAVCLGEILKDAAFLNRTIEVGGPQVLTMEELLVKIRRQGTRPPVVHLPAGLMSAAVAVLEKFLLPVLPFTAGQIASFVNDGTAAQDACVSGWQSRMLTLDQMLSPNAA